MTPIRFAAIIAACTILGGTAGAEPGSPIVTIALTSYRFDPSPIVLGADRPVRLSFENKAGRSHDFVAREFFAAAQITSGHVTKGGVDLKGGEKAVVELVPKRGVYHVHCSKFLHSSLGMKSRIIVQ